MRKISMILISLVFLHLTNLSVFAEDKKLNISPIVQVISYFDVYGKHPKMM
jgi:hypothetical protein